MVRRRAPDTPTKTVPRFVRRTTRFHSDGHTVTHLDSVFDGLRIIADHLNALPELQSQAKDPECPLSLKQQCAGWMLAERVVSAPSLPQAGARFKAVAAASPVEMVVEVHEGEPHTVISSRDEIGTVLWHLWLFYFRDYGWERLKRCPVCRRWFVDHSDNRKTLRCSLACTSRWWSRDRRKKAGHTLTTTKKGARHGTTQGRQDTRTR